MNVTMKRLLSLLLCFVMLVGVMPTSVFAEESAAEESAVVEMAAETVAETTAETETEKPAKSVGPKGPGQEEKPGKPEKPGQETVPATEATVPVTEETVPETTEETIPETTEATVPAVTAVTGITLDQAALEVGVGAEPVTLTATVAPENAADKTVTWTSSEPGVASVADGVVTFGYMGEAVITATAGEFSATCTVTVGEGETADYVSDEVIDAAIFCSDVHGNSSTVTSVFNGIKNADSTFNPTTASFVGDTQMAASSVTSAAQKAFSDVKCYYAFGNHDDEGNYGIDSVTGLLYGDDSTNYYIYVISEQSMGSSRPDTSGFTNTVAGLDKSKPLFIISHLPLHSRRGDSNGAAVWYPAIEAAAEQMDIAFFWGHNHTGEGAADTAAYYVAKDGSETITLEDTSTVVTPNFTYANAGYIQPPNGGARTKAATAVRIYDDRLNFTVYTTSGELTGTYAVNETVAREFADSAPAATLSSIAISGKTQYVTGDKLELTVAAAYSDNSTVDVTEQVEWTNLPDMTTAGTFEVTAAFGEQTVAETITVWKANFADDASGVTVRVTGDYGVTAVSVIDSVNGNVAAAIADVITGENYKAYDISLIFAEGYTQQDAAKTVTLPIPEGVNNPVVYYVSDDGSEVTNMKATKGEGVVTFTTNHFSTYVVGEGTGTEITVPDPETATGSGSTTTKQEKEVYVLVSAPTAGKQYIIVNRNTAGSGYALKENTTTGYSITVNAAGNSISAPYIETTDKTIMWNATSGLKFRSENGKYYLRYNDGLAFHTSNSTNWTYSNNRLSYSVSNGWWGSTTYYLRYNDSKWSASTTQSNVYFYEKQTVDVETSTTVSGTYSIAGKPAEVTKVAKNGSTAELNSVLTFTPADGSAATTTENPSGVTYTVVEGGDPNGVISGISGNTVTFSGNYGKALVKVSKEVSFGSETKTVTNYIVVTASEPTYVLDIMDGETVVTGTTVSVKGVTASTTLQLGTQIQFVDGDADTDDLLTELPEGATMEWHIPENYHNIATVDHETGLVSFKGVDGAFYVTATLSVNGKDYTAGVIISATTSSYSVPSDGVSDFPEYPNEGAIRYDKTATAVGNFSQTGIAQLELSMTGVPYTTGSEIDVVLMLDITGSMDDTDDRIPATKAAAKAFVKSIVVNEDGSYNDNRVGVYWFNKNGTGTTYDFGTIDSDTELKAINAAIDSFDDNQASGGTPYDDGLSKCSEVLAAAKKDGIGNDRQQFCVFMSDGVPTDYEYINGTSHANYSSASSIAGMLTSSSDYATRDTDYKYEYYSTEMKKAGATVYTVGLGLFNENSAWSGTATQCGNLASALLNDISGPANEASQPDAIGTSTLSKKDKFFFSVEDATAATDMEKVFKNIAAKILQAATDVTVEDKITDKYTMIFDIPKGDKTISGVTNDFYIEFGKYALDGNHERTTYTSNTKLYLKNTNGTLSAASDKSGTAYAAPVFEQKTIGDKGTLYYWTTTDTGSGISVSSNGTTYYFDPYGSEEAGYNMTSGAYANGKVDSTTNMSNDLVIATPYFVYNAKQQIGTDGEGNPVYGQMLYWTVDKLDTEECVLRYFLYLDNSATEVGTNKETDPGSYLTNDHAYITYTNFKGNDCRQEFPKPQLTWNGAQVSYVFYLVNAAGQPINKSGQVVDFANATFITDVFTTAVVWNKEGNTTTGTGELSANWLADDLLPDEYEIYDEKAHYALNVYENADGSTIKNQFAISGGTAAEISASLNERLSLATTTANIATTMVYNTKAGEKISTYGTYTSADSKMKDFDFANTTVAFAVVWQPRLVPDTVVVDYGLDVLINVVENDILQNTVSGIGLGNAAYGSLAMNTGVSETSKLGTAELKLNGNTISIENKNEVRFHQGDMQFEAPVVFYYETPVEFWEGSHPTEGYMYSSVTVIPATTIYYEDSFVTFTNSGSATETLGRWTKVGDTVNATQAQDRPGVSQISADLDADNNYGYDETYSNMSQHSLGSAMKVSVAPGISGMASFDFYGTGFDVISMTDTTTGNVMVQVFDEAGNQVRGYTVDTYYGYERAYRTIVVKYDAEKDETKPVRVAEEGDYGLPMLPENPTETGYYLAEEVIWVTTDNGDPLYQVPVIKVTGLPYGKYKAKVIASYVSILDHQGTGSYDFYLDAIRIYDPTGNEDDTANGAYVKDGEGWPEYYELRKQIIDNETFTTLGENDTVSGIVFIDGTFWNADNASSAIVDYLSYGPNNELYLASDNAVAFDLNATAAKGKVAKVQLAVKSVGTDPASIKIYSPDGTTVLDTEITTASDMYYDITALNGKTVVIMNDGEDGILSITNVKVTYTEAQTENETPTNLFTLRRASVEAVLETLKEEEEVPETTVPETTEPEETEPEETKPAEPDNSELKAAVEKAKKLKSKGYTKESFKKLQTAIKAAEKVLKNRKATQNQIDKALDALNAALENLEAKPDFSKLEKALKNAKKLKAKDYTKESFKKLQTAIKAAEKVLKNRKAIQTEIDEALADLNKAVEALETASKAKPGKKK